MTKQNKQHVTPEQEWDFSLFHQGKSRDCYRFMGAHRQYGGGFCFRVWAPNARSVSVVGDFNNWDRTKHPMERITKEGIWEITIAGLAVFSLYKYSFETSQGRVILKADPYAFHFETRPGTASMLYDLADFVWTDEDYQRKRQNSKPLEEPMNIYEVHLGSWRRYPDGAFFSYQKLAEELVPYVKQMGYTHVELMPVGEYPFDGSWGYQSMGYYAPTSRYGTPHDFMYFIDTCHRAGLGVILDWVPAHFPKDEAGLYEFDGTCCYEPADPLMQEHPDWGTRLFDYSRNEVRSFLISNALFYLDVYHIDGIRVDAVASMLYLDYGRQNGAFRPNQYGGKENLSAVSFLQELNEAAFLFNPKVLMIAEESTAWPLVTKPVYEGGLGFLYKWNMGWMNDDLDYMSKDPLFRSGVHHRLTFSMSYAFSENYVLALSHDEVVHGKCSLINKMPGDYEQKFANLRAFLGYQMAHPGKKLLFMGNEFAQFSEWDFQKELDWLLLDFDQHRKFKKWVCDLNHFYLKHSELWEIEDSWDGFLWLVADDYTQNILAFIRRNRAGQEILCVFNFSPVLRFPYRLGFPHPAKISRILSSEERQYGGEGRKWEWIETENSPSHGFDQSLLLSVAPMSAEFYSVKTTLPKRKGEAG